MVGVVQGFRWAILGAGKPEVASVALSAGIAVFLLLLGLIYFRKMERTFADVV
jgi:lipopolysaccharide transport system permease protein